MKKRYCLCFLIGFLLFVNSTHLLAQLTVEAGVSYQMEDDEFSDYYWREVDIVSGSILNRNSILNEYSFSSDYVIVWFSQNEAAVIELTSVRFSSITRSEISKDIFNFTLRLKGDDHKGVDKNGTNWKICFNTLLKSFCD
ncbi:MAG: hypothetical protein HUJ22_02320 [Gracilimonas sp.]|uniref:hypothetical protein n=1 Tax=Gracilimonas sp. TaxID=1974203 RepID=UPI0019BA53B7|nr:hypothetical protein [Gracilimonas sp.]MBD3615380.1 hypothetical protein [Gracilimonas sp.]